MIYRALLNDLNLFPKDWNIIVLVNSDIAQRELRKIQGKNLSIVKIPGYFSRISIAIQGVVTRYYCNRYDADVLLTQNHYLNFNPIDQIVLHVNVFSFKDNSELVSLRDRIKQKIRQHAAKKSLKEAALNIFESRYLLQLARTSIAEDIENSSHVYYAGINVSRDIKSAKFKYDGRPISIAVITSDNPHKRNYWIPEIAALLLEHGVTENIVFEIYGQGEWVELKKKSEALKVEHMIKYRGYFESEALMQKLSNSFCLVSTSEVESFCTVALEAMIRGVPALVSNTSSMPESVGDAGLLINESDGPNGFADVIKKLIGSEDYRSSVVERGLDHASKYSWGSGSKELIDIVQSYCEESANYNEFRR